MVDPKKKVINRLSQDTKNQSLQALHISVKQSNLQESFCELKKSIKPLSAQRTQLLNWLSVE